MKLDWKIALVVSTLFSFLICWPALIGGRVFYFGDNYHLIIPQKIFLVEQIKQGVLPFWNPYTLSGIPFFADINQAIFYPSTLLFLILPIPAALTLTIFFHLVVAGLGQYFFVKSLRLSDFVAVLSMTIFMFSQPLLMSINHVNFILLQTFSWMPWILGVFVLLVRDGNKKASLLLPLFISLAIMGGHPQPLLYLIIPGFVYLYVNQRNLENLRLLIPSLAFSFLLTMVVTIPFVELFRYSTRYSMGTKEALNDSIKPAHYIDFIFPNFFSDPSVGMRWGIYWIDYRKAGVYISWIGLLALLLAVVYKQKSKDLQWLKYSVLIVLILSLGKNLPYFTQLVERIKILQSVRNYSLILILFPVFASVLVGNSINLMTKKFLKNLIIPAAAALALSLLFGLMVNYKFESFWEKLSNKIGEINNSAFHTYERDLVILRNVSTNAIYSAIFLILGIAAIRWLPRKIWKLVIVVLIWIDMYRVAKPLLIFGNPEVYNYKNNPIYSYLNHFDTQQYRIMSGSGFFPYSGIPDYWANLIIGPPFANTSVDSVERESNAQLINRRNVFGSNWNMPYRLMTPFGTSAFVLRDAASYWKSYNLQSQNINEVDMPNISDARISDQGVKYVFIDKTVFEKELPVGLKNMGVIIDSPKWAIYENLSALPIIRFANNKDGKIRVDEGNVNQINFSTSTTSNDFVLIKMANYPGWKCIMDSQPCSIIPDGFTMKVAAPKGDHEFRLDFIPTGWPYLAYISGFGWLAYLLMLARKSKIWYKIDQ